MENFIRSRQWKVRSKGALQILQKSSNYLKFHNNPEEMLLQGKSLELFLQLFSGSYLNG